MLADFKILSPCKPRPVKFSIKSTKFTQLIEPFWNSKFWTDIKKCFTRRSFNFIKKKVVKYSSLSQSLKTKLNCFFFNPGPETRPDGEQFHGDRQFGDLRGRPRRRLRPLRRRPAVGLVRNVRQVAEDANPQSHPQVRCQDVQCFGELGSHIQVTSNGRCKYS